MNAPAATVLVVDDDPQSRRLLELLLQPGGYVVRHAATGEAALADVAQHSPDLILLDIMLPGMDGHQVASILKADPASADIPIIMVTALADGAARLRGLESGAEEFLTKPVDRGELFVRVRNMLRLKAYGELLKSQAATLEHQVQERTIAITRLNRIHAVLSGINAVIVRTRARDELFNEVCRIAVEDGGFYMSLIATVGPVGGPIMPVASRGKDVALQGAIEDILASPEHARTMVARSVREKRPIVSNDLPADTQVLFRDRYAAYGVRSVAVLPLIVADKAVGVVALYSREPGFFDQAEMKLLNELADNIAFAIDYIGQQDRLHFLAYYDELTGLANRGLLLERMAKHMRSADAGGHEMAVFLIDLERFKNLNDSLGQAAGDALLQQVAAWLTRRAGGARFVARLDADHIVVVLPRIEPGGNLARLLENAMMALLDHAFQLKGSDFRIGGKVGAARYPQDGADPDGLLKNAEAALKNAKASGDRYLFYTPTLTEHVAGKLTLENQLRQAIDRQEFVLHYQPKTNLVSGRLASAEALIRWNDPRTGLVPPNRFIPVLEETGLIYEAGRWALRKAIEDYLRWRNAGLPAVRIAVNVSPLQLRSRDFITEIEEAISVDTHAAAGLELEITESLIMADVDHSIATLHAIRAMGVTIAIDDFGTGFSSLNYLAKLPVDTLKVDRTFVSDMMKSREGLALVSTIIKLAHSLKLNVVAEGVETEEQARMLRLLNCDEMQGYLFSRPVPAEIFEAKFLVPASPAGLMESQTG